MNETSEYTPEMVEKILEAAKAEPTGSFTPEEFGAHLDQLETSLMRGVPVQVIPPILGSIGADFIAWHDGSPTHGDFPRPCEPGEKPDRYFVTKTFWDEAKKQCVYPINGAEDAK